MNKRTIKTIIILMLLCLLSMLALSACAGNREKKVSSIRVVEGSFKEIYALDEKLNLNNAKIQVTYTDGSNGTVAITESMVTGFDTSTTTNGRTITITYKEASTNFIYKVQSSVAVDTSFRFKLDVTEDADQLEYNVNVKADKASLVPGGVYALRFTLSTTGGIALNTPTLKLDGAFKMEIYSVSVSSMVVVVYSETGYDMIADGAVILNVKASKPTEKGAITVQNGSISDGTTDLLIPQTICELGE